MSDIDLACALDVPVAYLEAIRESVSGNRIGLITYLPTMIRGVYCTSLAHARDIDATIAIDCAAWGAYQVPGLAARARFGDAKSVEAAFDLDPLRSSERAFYSWIHVGHIAPLRYDDFELFARVAYEHLPSTIQDRLIAALVEVEKRKPRCER